MATVNQASKRFVLPYDFYNIVGGVNQSTKWINKIESGGDENYGEKQRGGKMGV